jgi:uncharacterized protein (DUF1501 family)
MLARTATRRDFMRRACAALGAAAGAQALESLRVVAAHAQSAQGRGVAGTAEDYRALVCVFLGGGNDSWNTVIDLDEYASYAGVRGSLALPQGSLVPIQTLTGSRHFGLHPSLADLQPLWQARKLALLCNVGTLVRPITRAEYLAHPELRPINLFSHSDQVYQWHSGSSNPPLPTGWGGRLADRTGGLNSASTFPLMASIAGVPLFGTGESTRPLELTTSGSLALSGFSNSATSQVRWQGLLRAQEVDRSHAFVRAGGDTLLRSIGVNQVLSAALASAPPLATAFPATSLGDQLKMVARTISVRAALGMRRQLFFCSLGGFDTHSNQLATQASLLTQVGQALAAFHAATVELQVADGVTAFTHSDFSRTYKFNGGGTDHAWGSCQFVLGGAVRGGDAYGQWPTLALGGPDDSGSSGRFIPTTAVDQYTATLALWFGLPAADVPLVFPNIARFDTADLGFMA